MTKIGEQEFKRICDGIFEDREIILRHNPIGTQQETLLWMLLNCLGSYLSLTDVETPCFTAKPTEQTYREAILFVLKDRRADNFKVETYLDDLCGVE